MGIILLSFIAAREHLDRREPLKQRAYRYFPGGIDFIGARADFPEDPTRGYLIAREMRDLNRIRTMRRKVPGHQPQPSKTWKLVASILAAAAAGLQSAGA